MQTYPLSLRPLAQAASLAASADLFVYESGKSWTRTNLIPYSNQFENAAWTATGVAVTPSAGASWDGTNTAALLTENTANAAHEMRTPSLTLTAGTTYTISAYAKAGTRSLLCMGFSSVFSQVSASVLAVFDLVAGTVVNNQGPPDAYSITPVAGAAGWYRCSITSTITKTATGTNYIGMRATAGTGVYVGDGASNMYIAGAQVEPANVATALIPTTTAAVSVSDADLRIIVKPDNGAEIVLRPGQRFRLPPGPNANLWNMRSYDPSAGLDAAIIIGSGEFDDANTLNAFTFDTKSGAIPVNVQNAVTLAGGEIEIKNDTGNRIPVALDAKAPSGATVVFNQYWSDETAIDTVTGLQIFAAGANVNGVMLNKIECLRNSTYAQTLYITNGTTTKVIKYIGPGSAEMTDVTQYLLPAGYALYWRCIGSSFVAYRQVHYTAF